MRLHPLLKFALLLLLAIEPTPLHAIDSSTNKPATNDPNINESLGHLDAKLSRQMNELIWFQRLNDVAAIDKVRFTGPPPRKIGEPVPSAGSNEVVIPAMTFLPRNRTRVRSIPLIVFVHGEIHGNVATDEDLHVVRELIGQGYAVIAPDYRGSSGYGGDFWRLIDYGGQCSGRSSFQSDRYATGFGIPQRNLAVSGEASAPTEAD